MADLSSDWSAKANDALAISLVVPDSGGSKTIASFHPKFTYSIFGDDESIFGYQGLKIHLRYHACDMRPGIQISYEKKFKPIGETSATDVVEVLDDILPKVAFEKSAVFDTAINNDLYKDWKPPGELLKQFDSNGVTKEIWMGNMTDKAIQQIIKRIQILIPLFIEGGTSINLKDPNWSLDRWTVFFLYEKRPDLTVLEGFTYVFMGYSTVYRFFHYPLPTPPLSPHSKKQAITPQAIPEFEFPISDYKQSDLPCRSRISQFLILPAFQGDGNGSRFYESIFTYYLHSQQTVEITVEDPNEAFDDLRDLNDLKRLRTYPEFTSLRINASVKTSKKSKVPTAQIVDVTTLKSLRRKTKIAPRQFMRLVEMQLLTYIPTSIRKSLLHEQKKGPAEELRMKEQEYHLWQLFVKQRLYRHNKDTLIQLDRAERIDKLDDAADSVEADYGRLLRTLDMRGKAKPGSSNGESSRKRSAVEDEDDDGAKTSLPKRARVEEE